MSETRICPECKESFERKGQRHTFCVPKCKRRNWKRNHQVKRYDKRAGDPNRRDEYGLPQVATPRPDRDQMQVLFTAFYDHGQSVASARRLAGLEEYAEPVVRDWLAHPEVFSPFRDAVVIFRFRCGDRSVLSGATVYERDEILRLWVHDRPLRWSDRLAGIYGFGAQRIAINDGETSFIEHMTRKASKYYAARSA